jgi:aerobic carbon-monoxide dehydrogenase medium subunit
MKARAFLYRRPSDIAEAVALLGDDVGGAQVLAGGQSLIPTLNMRLSSPRMLVDINRIDALRGIEDRGQAIRIGALVRHADVLESNAIAQRVPLLAMAIPHVAHMAVRNRGTTCGSLALADPSAEMPAVAVTLNADIVLRRRGSERRVAARDFFQDLYQTARTDDELITEVVFRTAEPDEIFGFCELSRRHGDFATVGVAARARRSGRNLGDLDVVIFGSEPTPLLYQSAAGSTLGGDISDEALSEMARAITKDMTPIASHQGRGDTKRRQAGVLLKRALKDMMMKAKHG